MTSWAIGSAERLAWKHSEKLMLLKMEQLSLGYGEPHCGRAFSVRLAFGGQLGLNDCPGEIELRDRIGAFGWTYMRNSGYALFLASLRHRTRFEVWSEIRV
jgi:hypothetical protein